MTRPYFFKTCERRAARATLACPPAQSERPDRQEAWEPRCGSVGFIARRLLDLRIEFSQSFLTLLRGFLHCGSVLLRAAISKAPRTRCTGAADLKAAREGRMFEDSYSAGLPGDARGSPTIHPASFSQRPPMVRRVRAQRVRVRRVRFDQEILTYVVRLKTNQCRIRGGAIT